MAEWKKGLRQATRQTPKTRAALHTLCAAAAGLLLGTAAKFADLYTQNLGNIFSEASVWIFLCTLLAAYSSTPKRAALRVFLFCAAMLGAYYLTAELTHSVYSLTFVRGWAVVCLCSPALAAAVWYARGRGVAARLLAVGILLVMLGVAWLLFDGPGLSDIVLAALTALALFR